MRRYTDIELILIKNDVLELGEWNLKRPIGNWKRFEVNRSNRNDYPKNEQKKPMKFLHNKE